MAPNDVEEGAYSNLEIEAHALEPAIVIRFDATKEAGGRQQRKIIQLDGLSEYSDSAAVARLVLDQCKPLIPFSRLSELEQLVLYIQKRLNQQFNVEPATSISNCEIHAKIENLEDYMELLYEEGEPKQRGVVLLAELVQHLDPIKLAKIVENDQLMGALTRDSRKNFELAIHLAQLFHRISQFLPFHSSLYHYKIGLLSLQLAEYELRRWELWREQTREMDEQAKRKWEFAMRKQDQLIALSFRILLNLADEVRTENKMLKKGLLPMLFKALEHTDSPQLLMVSVKFLWKLCQFEENQLYILNTSGTIEQLVRLFPPPRVGNDTDRSSSSIDFISALSSLLFNCSFEITNRRRMVTGGLVSLLAPHISENNIALSLMYQLSIVDDAKAIIAFTDCIPLLLNMLLHEPQTHHKHSGEVVEKRAKLVRSLLVNIVLEKRNAQLLCESDGQGLDSLMAIALDGEDDEERGDLLAMKIARNIASHEGPTRDMFLKWVPQLVENAIDRANSVYGLECMGICAQLPNVPWAELEQNYGILAFLMRMLEQSSSTNGKETVSKKRGDRTRDGRGQTKTTDGVLLQAVQWCGTLAGHSLEMAELVEKQLLPLLVTLLNKDDELVLQCTFTFVSLLSHGGELARRICFVADDRDENNDMQSPSVVALLLNLMHDHNPRLRALCEQALQQIAELSEYWRQRIQESRFRWHNAQWLEMFRTPETTFYDQLTFKSDGERIEMADHHPPEEGIFIDGLIGENVLDSEELLKGTEF